MVDAIKKAWGKFVYALALVLGFLFDIVINFLDLLVGLVKTLGRGILSLISMGGCLLFFLIGPGLMFNPMTTLFLIFLIGFPIIGIKFISFLKYKRYAITEYLFDYADSLTKGRKAEFSSSREYGNKYKRMEAEREREEERKRQEEQRRRQEEQARQWEERFSQWFEYERSQTGSGYGSYNWQGQGYGGSSQTFTNPSQEFISKYEESCRVLGVDKNADKYDIKLSYRKKAKENHPDVNKSPGATQQFQKINDAYEFLSEANIDRYAKMN